MHVNYLIIGQGLAGSLLAWRLIQRNQKILIIDTGLTNASKISAGLINPLTGPRMAKSDEFDQQLECAKKLYQQFSAKFKQQFYFEMPMWRFLRTENDLAIAVKRLQNSDYQPYLNGIITDTSRYQSKDVLAILQQKQSGYLLTANLLNHLKDYFLALGCLREYRVIYDEINLANEISWHDIKADKIVFCEGFQVVNNPWFCYLPVQPVKGEILTFSYENRIPNCIVNDGKWLLPLKKQKFRLGATFERNQIDSQTSSSGKMDLLKALERIDAKLLKAEIIAHDANIRPCSHDRSPYLGQHPNYSNLFVFNGFGSKGSLQIPWHSEVFSDYLITGKQLQSESNIDRI